MEALNNFEELYNTFCLVNPKFVDHISAETSRHGGKRKSDLAKGRWASLTSLINKNAYDAIEELKAMMDPFVHVHRRTILQESLPGLSDTLAVLTPTDLQKKLLERISENVFEKHVGVKTQFVIELVRLIKAQEGKQVLYVDGKLDEKQRQVVIHSFNDHNNEAKVLLASTKAYFEGINFVGTMEIEKYQRQTKKDRISELVLFSTNGHKYDQSEISNDKILEAMNSISSAGVQNSASFTSTLPAVGNLTQDSMPNVVGHSNLLQYQKQHQQQQPQHWSILHHQQMLQTSQQGQQQKQQLIGQQPNTTNIQQNQLIGQPNSIPDLQRQQRLMGQQKNTSNIQQQQFMGQQNNLSNMHQTELGPQKCLWPPAVSAAWNTICPKYP
ncbi:hypothetical protein M9H77_25334 [Catharanthus roseus]|uniref:Uncharacterized protein n=1 Tax=Catharanthus roseus TaxID=4058 RepID=A0ACC0A7I2_CATRO|nr:hypothetical protein M9H77_25334 [Catharanthus roseus]